MDKIDKVFDQVKDITKGFKKLIDIVTDEEDTNENEDEKDGN
jgi:hypothetical protein